MATTQSIQLELKLKTDEALARIADLEREMQALIDRVGKVGKASGDTVSTSIGSLKSSIGDIVKGMAAFNIVETSFSAMRDAVFGLERATAQIRTIGGAAREIAPELEQLAVQMSTRVPLSAAELQAATYDALSAGIEANKQSIEAFMQAASSLAVGGGEKIKNTVNILSSLVNAYGESADKARVFSDQLFATVNLGKTTIPELSSALSQVIPTAASVKLSFDSIGGALAVMTASGIPTQQAATKLNQLLVQMIKPGEELAQVMQHAGVTLQSLAQEGLATTVAKLSASMKELGLQAGAVFTSVEASAAFSALANDTERFAAAVRDVGNATGTTDAAMRDMTQTTEAQLEHLQRMIEQIVIEIGGQVLEIVTPVVSTVATIVGEVGKHKEVVLSLVAAFAAYKSLNSDLLAGLSKLPQQIIAATTAMIAKTTATNAATVATNALKAAWATNPLGLAIAGIMAAVAAFNALKPLLIETTEDKIKNAEATQQLIQKQIDETRETIKAKEAKKALADEYIALAEKSNRTAAEQERLKTLHAEVTKTYPSLISSSSRYAETLAVLKEQSARTGDELVKLNSRLDSLNKQAMQNQQRLLELQAQSAQEKMLEVVDTFWSKFSISMGGINAPQMMADLLRRAAQDLSRATPETFDQLAAQLRSIAVLEADNLVAFIRKTYGYNEQQARQIVEALKRGISSEDLLEISNRAEQLISAQQRLLTSRTQAAQQQQKAVTAAAQEEVSAYDRINRALQDLARNRPKSEEMLNKQVSAIKAQIEAAQQAGQLDAKQADQLFARLEAIKESAKKRAQSEDDMLKKQIEQIKAIRDEKLEREKQRQQEEELLRLREGRAKTADEEIADAQAIAAIHKEAAEAAAKIKIPDSRKDAAALRKDNAAIQQDASNAALQAERLLRKQAEEQEERLRQLREQALQNLQARLDITADPEAAAELRKKIIAALEAERDRLTAKIAVTTDELDKAKLEGQLLSLQKQLDDQQLKLRLDLVASGNVSEIAEAEYNRALEIAKQTYEQELAAAGASLTKQLAARQKFEQAKLDLQQKYLNDSLKLENIYRAALQDSVRQLIETLIGQSDAFAAALNTLNDRAKAQQQSAAQDRKAIMDDYIKGRASANKTLAALADAEAMKAQQISEAQRRMMETVVKSAEAMYKSLASKAQKIAEEILPKNIESITDLVKVNIGAISQYAEVSLGMASSAFGAMLAAGMSAGEAFTRGILDTLLKQAEMAIMTYIPQIYAAFAALLGPLGIPAATGAIAIVTALLEAARAKIAGFATGVVGIEGPGTETSDSILVRVSKGESIITAQATRANRDMLEWINRTGQPVERYIERVIERRYAERLMQGSATDDRVIGELRTMRTAVERSLRGRRDTYSHVELDVHVSDRALIDRIEQRRINALRRL